MFCKNCGSTMDSAAAVCIKCGVIKGTGRSFCHNCGSKTDPSAAVCIHCGVLTDPEANSLKPKNDFMADLKTFFTGKP